jgi:hypothetical protein
MRPLALLALLASIACGGSGGDTAAPPPAKAYDPDVPAWRGGCFFEGPAGKVVNGSPSFDVRVYGAPCQPGGTGGLVYLDNWDLVAGTGDVTVLPSTAGARPVVVARSGGGGGIVPGNTGVRFDGPVSSARRLLTLRDVGFVSGQLVLVDLAAPGTPAQIGTRVRVLNYDFLSDGAVAYLGNYDADAREGDLFVWRDGASSLVATDVSRAEFDMFRLDPSRTRAAYLQGWTETGGGDLLLVDLVPATSLPRVLASRAQAGAERFAWTEGGALVWSVRDPGAGDGSATLHVLAPGADPSAAVTVSSGVRAWSVAGDLVVYVAGWSVLSGHGTLGRWTLAGGPAEPVGRAALEFATVPARDGPASAFVQVDGTDRRSGALLLARAGGAPALVDDRVAPRAGFWFSPAASLVAYARDWRDPFASGSASPQPGVAGEVRVARVAGGAPFTVATNGSMQWIAWDPLERWVAALADFDDAANAGRLVVRDTATGAALPFSAERVSPFWFDFGAGGELLAAIRGWDDALQRGELVLARSGDWAAAPVVVSRDVTSYLPPVGGRIVYAVRGSGRDGLWLH